MQRLMTKYQGVPQPGGGGLGVESKGRMWDRSKGSRGAGDGLSVT